MLSLFLFLLVISWITKSLDSKETGIQWISRKSLDDLEFARDLALLSHPFNHMWEKIHCLDATAIGLRIDKDKSKIMKVMTDCLQTVSLIKVLLIKLRSSHIWEV